MKSSSPSFHSASFEIECCAALFAGEAICKSACWIEAATSVLPSAFDSPSLLRSPRYWKVSAQIPILFAGDSTYRDPRFHVLRLGEDCVRVKVPLSHTTNVDQITSEVSTDSPPQSITLLD